MIVELLLRQAINMTWRDTLRKQDDKIAKQNDILKQAQDMLSREINENMSAMQRDANKEMKALYEKIMQTPDGPAKDRMFDRMSKLIDDLKGPVGSSEL